MAMITFASGQETGFSAKAVATHNASVMHISYKPYVLYLAHKYVR